MTALETLQKYGLKTDAKSIIERIDTAVRWDGKTEENCDKIYWFIVSKFTDDREDQESFTMELFDADLALLCSLAEKGKRVEAWKDESKKAIEKAWIIMNDHGANTTEEITLVRHAIRVAREITRSYAEAEGE